MVSLISALVWSILLRFSSQLNKAVVEAKISMMQPNALSFLLCYLLMFTGKDVKVTPPPLIWLIDGIEQQFCQVSLYIEHIFFKK